VKRKNFIAGNWKMNKTPSEAKALLRELVPLAANAACDVAVCVPFVDIFAALQETKGSNIIVAAQNCHFEKSGAFTGEISANMLADCGVSCVIVGHSERRAYFGDTNETVAKRLKAGLDAGLRVILCVGETLESRESGKTFDVVGEQIKTALSLLSASELAKVVVAYEPVWAIGTGKTASPEQANEVCAFIRGVVAALFGAEIASELLIQYGGSMNAQNAAELLAQPDIDGGLIGGASLKAADFAEIIKAAS
jgi:triosephosphate isomerase